MGLILGKQNKERVITYRDNCGRVTSKSFYVGNHLEKEYRNHGPTGKKGHEEYIYYDKYGYEKKKVKLLNGVEVKRCEFNRERDSNGETCTEVYTKGKLSKKCIDRRKYGKGKEEENIYYDKYGNMEKRERYINGDKYIYYDSDDNITEQGKMGC